MRVHEIYAALVEGGEIKVIGTDISDSIKEKFIDECTRIDKRIAKVKKNKIRCSLNDDGAVECAVSYYNKAYRREYRRY